MPARIAAIVAMAENSCIGHNNDLPWHIPEDLKRFKALTLGKPVIMGRKTYDSIVMRLGRPLPGRANIVITRTPGNDGAGDEGPFYVKTLDEALARAQDIAQAKNLGEIFIGGGGQIFELALPLTDRIYLTKVHLVVNGDAFFPGLHEKDWRITGNEHFPGEPSYSFMTLERA